MQTTSRKQQVIDLAMKWRRAVSAAERTEEQLSDWIAEHGAKMTEADRNLFRIVYDTGRVPSWHLRIDPSLSTRKC